MTNASAKRRKQLYTLVITALFAAMICVTTAYIFHIPFGTNGGYVHVGDALIYLAAALLPTPYAMLAGALGGSLADLLTAPLWAPATFMIKMLLALPFTCKKATVLSGRNLFAVVPAALISFLGYWAAEWVLFGTWAAVLPTLAGSLIQSGSSAVLFIALGFALDRMQFKPMLLQKFPV